MQAESVLRRIRESGQMRTEIELLREAKGLPERVTAALFDATIGLQVRNSGYRALLRGWGAYCAAEPLRLVRASARKASAPIDTSTLFDPEGE